MTDGPHPEAKDLIGGSSIIEARDIDHTVHANAESAEQTDWHAIVRLAHECEP